MTLRERLIEAGARVGLSQVFDSLHPEDQEAYRVNAEEQLDAFLDVLAENRDEWVDVAVPMLSDRQPAAAGFIAALRVHPPTEEEG